MACRAGSVATSRTRTSRRSSLDNKYATHEQLPGQLFDEAGNRIFIKGYLLTAKQEGAQAVSRTVAQQTLNEALHKAAGLAGEEFVEDWIKHAYKLRIEGKNK